MWGSTLVASRQVHGDLRLKPVVASGNIGTVEFLQQHRPWRLPENHRRARPRGAEGAGEESREWLAGGRDDCPPRIKEGGKRVTLSRPESAEIPPRS